MPAESDITVFLVDDHEVVRAGVRAMLEIEPDIEIVGEAGTAADAVRGLRHHSPDVALLDVRLPDGSGVEVCREARSDNPELRVLMLTSFADDEALFNSILAGASGFLLKQVRSTDLAGAVRRIAAGESLLDQGVHDRVMRRLRGEGGDPDSRLLADLTEKEREILSLIALGLTNRQIADRVHLAEKTIKNYVSAILAKLGVSRRAEAAAFMVRQEAKTSSDTIGDPPPPNWP